jgi:hypothetical protein
MALAAIRSTLETTVAGVAGLPPVFFENVPESIAAGSAYVRCVFAPVTARPEGAAANPTIRHQGLLTMTVCVPALRGPQAAHDIATLIMDAFPVSGVLPGTPEVGIDYVELNEGFGVPPFYCAPVRIGWHALVYPA